MKKISHNHITKSLKDAHCEISLFNVYLFSDYIFDYYRILITHFNPISCNDITNLLYDPPYLYQISWSHTHVCINIHHFIIFLEKCNQGPYVSSCNFYLKRNAARAIFPEYYLQVCFIVSNAV